MQAADICNNALDLIGQGTHIDSMEEGSREAELCRRLLNITVERMLDMANFSFARKDEVITEDFLLPDAVSIPWKFTFRLPEDVMRILYLAPLSAGSESEAIGYEGMIRFGLRLYDGQKVFTTDEAAPFVMQYQALIDDVTLFPPLFTQALEYYLAARLAANFVKSTTGAELSLRLSQYADAYLQRAVSMDGQQGLYSVKRQSAPAFIRGRR